MTPEHCPLCHGPVTISGRFAWCNKRRRVDRCGWGPVDLTRVAKSLEALSLSQVEAVASSQRGGRRAKINLTNQDGPRPAASTAGSSQGLADTALGGVD